MEENVEAFSKESVKQITEVEQTIVEGDDVKDDGVVSTVPSTIHGQ